MASPPLSTPRTAALQIFPQSSKGHPPGTLDPRPTTNPALGGSSTPGQYTPTTSDQQEGGEDKAEATKAVARELLAFK
ncbi:hypothetical protein B0A50_03620, partial [Salinomyces thailandicus]